MKREKAAQKIRELRKKITVLSFALSDSSLPQSKKFMIGITVAYALSPIDLIPDFIPILGYLDDLVILPLLIVLSYRHIPQEVLQRAERRADEESVTLKKNWKAAGIMIGFWVILLVSLIVLFIL